MGQSILASGSVQKDASTDTKVLIVGAGPAGACLAQILRKNNIAFEIFEREEVMGLRKGGAFGLDSCLLKMNGLLPEDLGSFLPLSVNYPINEPDEFSRLDTASGEIMGHVGAPFGQPGWYMQVRRDALRSWVTQHLNIQTGKKFLRYEEDDTGVTAYFADGTSARGSLLIGADGASSRIRKQLLDNPKRNYSQYPIICGEMTLTREQYAPIDALASSIVISFKPNNHSFLLRLDVAPDRSWSHYWWMQSFGAGGDAEGAANWVLTASREDLFQKALAQAEAQGPIFADALRQAGVESVWQPQITFSDWSPPDSLPRYEHGKQRRVTLMGDAAHNTLTFAALGANMSLTDACDLGTLIVKAHEEGGGPGALSDGKILARVLDGFERVMLPRGQETVAHSRRIADLSPPIPGGVGDRVQTPKEGWDVWSLREKRDVSNEVDGHEAKASGMQAARLPAGLTV